MKLLERSIEFGYGKLAVLRLLGAVHAGAVPTPKQWQYCRDIALVQPQSQVSRIFTEAVSLSNEQLQARSEQ